MQGITYSRSLSTGWKPPLKVRRQSAEQAQELRDRFHIIVEGQHLLPPILDFKDMRFPAAVLRQLAAKNITRPTPIQMQVDRGLCILPHLRSGAAILVLAGGLSADLTRKVAAAEVSFAVLQEHA